MQRTVRRSVLCDWGSSRLRAFLDVDGTTTDRREGPGIAALDGPPIAALRRIVDSWRESGDFDQIILCGMVGSRNGLIEVPYVAAPIACAAWAQGSITHRVDELDLIIAPGVCGQGTSGAPDVMRGEEAQIFGAFQCRPQLTQGHHVILLPGTHSKWVDVHDGKISSFQTFITGELFALLRDGSSLMRAGGGEGESDMGFTSGLGRAGRAGLAASLFETRSAQLLLDRTRGWAGGFLSGVLIGDEVATSVAARAIRSPVTVIGEPNLSALYRQALLYNGVETAELGGDRCVTAGLRLLATHLREVD
jgi:2-dehydro-3-deoxygalactonokinase